MQSIPTLGRQKQVALCEFKTTLFYIPIIIYNEAMSEANKILYVLNLFKYPNLKYGYLADNNLVITLEKKKSHI